MFDLERLLDEVEYSLLKNIKNERNENNSFYSDPIYKFKNEKEDHADLYIQINKVSLLSNEDIVKDNYLIYNTKLLENNDLMTSLKKLISKNNHKNPKDLNKIYEEAIKEPYILMNPANLIILKEYIIPLKRKLNKESNLGNIFKGLSEVSEAIGNLDINFMYNTTLNILDVYGEKEHLNVIKELYKADLINHIIVFSPFVEFKDYERELKELSDEFGVVYEKSTSLEEIYSNVINKLRKELKESNNNLYNKN